MKDVYGECPSFYDRAIEELQEDLLDMARQVSRSLALVMEALEKGDAGVAQGVIKADDNIDEVDHAIEMRALEVISLQQPTTTDLRVLASVLRIVKELERIGDYSVNIAQVAQKSEAQGWEAPPGKVSEMAEPVQGMFRDAITAYIQSDLDLALQVAGADDRVDRYFYEIQAEMVDVMKADPSRVEMASQMALVARYLERVADHSVNIAEMAHFKVTGERRPFMPKRARRVR
jgi:phosphate transport system protein